MKAIHRLLATKVSRPDRMRFAQDLMTFIPELTPYLEVDKNFISFRYPQTLKNKVDSKLKKLGWKLKGDTYVKPDGEWPMKLGTDNVNLVLSVPDDDGINPKDFVAKKAKRLLKVFNMSNEGVAHKRITLKSADEVKAELKLQLKQFYRQGFKLVDSQTIGDKYNNPYGGQDRGTAYSLQNKDWLIVIRALSTPVKFNQYALDISLTYVPKRLR